MNTKIISGMIILLGKKTIVVCVCFLWFDLASDWLQHNGQLKMILSIRSFYQFS